MPVEDLVMAWAELERALPVYEEAELMASGEIEEIFADEKIKAKLAATGEGYRFNLVKTPITVRASRCEISAVKVPDNEAATERIHEVWKANEMAIYYPTLIKETFKYGEY